MGISKEEAIKELQNRETVFVAYLLILWDFRGVSPCHRLNLCTLKVSTLNVPPLL